MFTVLCCSLFLVPSPLFPVLSSLLPVPTVPKFVFHVPCSMYPVSLLPFHNRRTLFPVPPSLIPSSLFPVLCSQFSVPSSLFPAPCSQLPVPYFQLPDTSSQYHVSLFLFRYLCSYNLFPVPGSVFQFSVPCSQYICSQISDLCSLFPYSQLPVLCSLYPVPISLFSVPYSLFPVS
jgi:hypothetical protein